MIAEDKTAGCLANKVAVTEQEPVTLSERNRDFHLAIGAGWYKARYWRPIS